MKNRQNSNIINITINATQTKILALMKKKPEITAKELAIEVGIAERSIKSSISKLKEAGLLYREGARKNGRWVVKQ